MGAIVFNVNATPSQETDSQALSNNSQAKLPLIGSNVSSGSGLSSKRLNGSKIANTTGLMLSINVLRQSSNLITSNVGRITGNSHFQNQVNNTLKLGATVVGLATHPILTSIAVAFDAAQYGMDSYFTERNDKIRSSQAQAIAGTLRGRKN